MKDPVHISKIRRFKRVFLAVLLLAAGISASYFLDVEPKDGVHAPALEVPSKMLVTDVLADAKGPSSKPLSPAQAAPSVGTNDLRVWLREYEHMDASQRIGAIASGVNLAVERQLQMKRLIQEQPELALDQAFKWGEVEKMPSQLRPFIETLFSGVGDFTRLPVCQSGVEPQVSPSARTPAILKLGDGKTLNAYAAGVKNELGSKKGIALQGISLDGIAAVHEGVFQRLTQEEAEAVRGRFGSGQADSSTSFATGKAIGAEPVRALAGGKVFVFANEAELKKLDSALVQMDLKPGPRAGSSAIFALPYAANGAGSGSGFNVAAAEMAAQADSLDWTTSSKKIFLIRIDFSDKVGSPVSKADAESVINGVTSTALNEMSYGKVSVSGSVSVGLYRVAGTAASYSSSSNTSGLLAAGTAAFLDKRATNGADATVDLSAFDVVGVSFADIGCSNSGVKFAGLASVGGGDLWMQGSNEAKVYVHELGHIFGLGHSNFWQTSNGSVVGTGEEKEYGDIYDVMGSGGLPKGHFHPQAKQKLSWIGSNQWADATASGLNSNVYRIYRHDDPLTSGSLRGVRITKSAVGAADSQKEYYWVGYRAAYADNDRLSRAGYLLWQRPGAVKSALLDMTPQTSGVKTDAGLDVGRTYADTTAKVYITPLGVGGTGSNQYLDVQVNSGTFASNRAPTLGAIDGDSSILARSANQFSIVANDADNDTLAYFWDAGDGTVSGGTSGLASFTHSWTMGGTYTLKVIVSDMKGGEATVTKQVVVSDAAQVLTKRTSGTAAKLNAVAASESLLVAVGTAAASGADKNVIRTSPDGITWTTRAITESTLNLHLKAVTWDGARFIAVGEDYNQTGGYWYGVVYTSESGFSWTRTYATSAAGTSLAAVVSGGGMIVAGGDARTLLYSSNGRSWTQATIDLPTGYSVGGLAYGDSKFVLTGHPAGFGYGDGVFFTSTDGSTWTDHTSWMGLDAKTDFRAIGYLNDRFVSSGWFSKLKVLTSGTEAFSTTRTANEEAYVLAYSSGLYFASGVQREVSGSSTSTTAVNLYSMDGTVWTGAAASASMATRNGGLFFNRRLVTVGDSGEIWQSDALQEGVSNTAPTISSDNLLLQSTVNARESISFGVTASDADGDTLTYNWDAGDDSESNTSRLFSHTWAVGGTYSVAVTVTDGKGGSATKRQTITVVDPLKTFSKRVSGGTQNFNSIAASDSIAVAVGDKGAVSKSTDGISWTSFNISPSLNLYLQAVTWDGTRFVAVGFDVPSGKNYFAGVIFTSADGESWTRRYTGATNTTSLRCVGSSGDVILAGGDSGTLVRSIDGGTNWSAVSTVPATHRIAGIAFGESTFVLTSHLYSTSYNGSARVFISANGQTWTEKSSGTGLNSNSDLRSIAYLKDRFVSSGWYSKIMASTDKGSTFSTTRSATELTPGLAYGNGVYFAAGQDQSASNAKVHVLSDDGVTWSQMSAPAAVEYTQNGAAFFKNTMIVVGNTGMIVQSGSFSAASSKLEIITQPSNLTLTQGSSALLQVTTTGGGSLSYQWTKNGSQIPSATLASFRISSASALDAGLYSVRVSDAASGRSVLSDSATVTYLSSQVTGGSVSITQQPVGCTVSEGAAALLRVAATGSGTLSYQWRKDGVSIARATSETYAISAASVADAGTYTVVVRDSAAGQSLVSSSAQVAVTASSESFVTASPPASTTILKGAKTTLRVSVRIGSGPSVNATTIYTLYALGGDPVPVGNSGIVPASGNVDVPLRRVSTSGHYFVRFTRTLSSGISVVSDTQSFVLNVVNWESMAGSYEALLVGDSSGADVLGDGSVYRGRLSLTLTNSGYVSGKVAYVEAGTLVGGSYQQRAYVPAMRPFVGAFAPVSGGSLECVFSSRLGSGSAAGRQELVLSADLGVSPPIMSASVRDNISQIVSGTLVSSAVGLTPVAASLSGSGSSLAGRYLIATDGAGSAGDAESQAFVALRVLESGRVFWQSRLVGYSGVGSATLNLADSSQPVARMFESRLLSSATQLTSTSLVGEMRFTLSGGSWRALIGSAELPKALEKQSSSVDQVLSPGSLNPVPAYAESAFADGSRWTGVSALQFVEGSGSRWGGLRDQNLPSFFPLSQNLTLSLRDPLLEDATGVFSWSLKVLSDGSVSDVVSSNGSPRLYLLLNRTSGTLSGLYNYDGVSRTLVGVALDSGTAVSKPVGRGWAEAAASGILRAGSWQISK